MSSLMGDIGSMLGINTSMATKSTNKSSGYDLSMEDFLQLMIVQLTSQTIDDTMDTSEMMNQMVQMQMVTALTNMTEISIQSYANSLVNQFVTVGLVNGNTLEERVIQVMGTGTYNGQQVIFGSDGNMYYLSQIMAVGILPNEDGTYGPQKPGDDAGDGEEDGNVVEDPVEGGNDNGDDDPAGANLANEISAAAEAAGQAYKGEQGAPTD